jgi:hypothetical protein
MIVTHIRSRVELALTTLREFPQVSQANWRTAAGTKPRSLPSKSIRIDHTGKIFPFLRYAIYSADQPKTSLYNRTELKYAFPHLFMGELERKLQKRANYAKAYCCYCNKFAGSVSRWNFNALKN